MLQITQPSQYRCTQLQYGLAVISEAPSIHIICRLSIKKIVTIFFYSSLQNLLINEIAFQSVSSTIRISSDLIKTSLEIFLKPLSYFFGTRVKGSRKKKFLPWWSDP